MVVAFLLLFVSITLHLITHVQAREPFITGTLNNQIDFRLPMPEVHLDLVVNNVKLPLRKQLLYKHYDCFIYVVRF